MLRAFAGQSPAGDCFFRLTGKKPITRVLASEI
jgi:hypothetical protein